MNFIFKLCSIIKIKTLIIMDLDIKEECKKMGMRFPVAQIHRDLGYSKGMVSDYYNGKKELSSKFKDAFIDFYNINEQIEQNKNDENARQVDFLDLNVMLVPLVNVYAQAGYLDGYGDIEYVDELPKIPFTDDREHKGNYLCFEVKGDSMDNGSYESYLERDILLCREVRQDLWKSKLHINKWDFVVVHKEDGILVKRITEHNVEKGKITLHSLNEYYDDKEVDLKDVAKIFNIVDVRRKRNRR